MTTSSEEALEIEIPRPAPSFRGALASRDFSLLFVGQLGAEIGNGLVTLALPLLVLDLTGSAVQLGAAYFFQFLPILLFGMVGGVFADRWDRRLTIVVVNSLRAVLFLSLGAIYYVGALAVEHLIAVIFIESCLANFFNPARAALLPNLVNREHLRPANSLMDIARQLGFLFAPPAGAILVAFLGPAAPMLFNGVGALLAAVCVFFIRWRPPERERQRFEGWLNGVQRVVDEGFDGMRTIGHNRLLQVALLLGASLNLVVAPIQLLLPLFVFDVKNAGAGYFGGLVAALLVGMIAGSLAGPGISRQRGLGMVTITAIMLLGVVICVAPWPPTIWPPVFAMAIAGACLGALNFAQTTMVQGATSDEERGRVSATYFTATLGVRPFGFLAMGALASAIDIRFLFVALGLMAIMIGAFLSRLPEVRQAH